MIVLPRCNQDNNEDNMNRLQMTDTTAKQLQESIEDHINIPYDRATDKDYSQYSIRLTEASIKQITDYIQVDSHTITID
jgi:hypothetical protein